MQSTDATTISFGPDHPFPLRDPAVITPLYAKRQEERKAKAAWERSKIAYGEASTRCSSLGSHATDADREAVRAAERAMLAREEDVETAKAEVARLAAIEAAEREALEREARRLEREALVAELSESRVAEAEQALEQAREAAEKAQADHTALVERSAELKLKSSMQPRLRAQAEREYAQAILRGEPAPVLPNQIDYAAVLRLAASEVAASEDKLRAAQNAVRAAELQVQKARASDVYAALWPAIAQLIDTLPATLPQPDGWARLLQISVGSDRVQLTVARDVK